MTFGHTHPKTWSLAVFKVTDLLFSCWPPSRELKHAALVNAVDKGVQVTHTSGMCWMLFFRDCKCLSPLNKQTQCDKSSPQPPSKRGTEGSRWASATCVDNTSQISSWWNLAHINENPSARIWVRAAGTRADSYPPVHQPSAPGGPKWSRLI